MKWTQVIDPKLAGSNESISANVQASPRESALKQ